jgi:hypothetical protein
MLARLIDENHIDLIRRRASDSCLRLNCRSSSHIEIERGSALQTFFKKDLSSLAVMT